MGIIYNIIIWLYKTAMPIAALFNPKAKQWVKGRRNILNKLENAIKHNNDIVWFHCASLGEFEQGKPIIESYKLKNPTHKILLTFFSSSGYEACKNYKDANWIFYLPADTKSNTKKFIHIVKPIKAIFIKYEFWFNYMSELKKQNIPFYSVSTVFRDGQAFFKYKWWRQQLRNVSHFFLQDKASAQLLDSIGFNNYTVSGDTRFDSVLANSQIQVKVPLIEMFSKKKHTIICGSTWPKDEIILSRYIKKHPENNYIIAPHEMFNICELQKKTNGLLYSKADKKNILLNNVLIIDSIGILSKIYKYGNLAYIGGGFGNGIHNILEAATFGLPVIFGPNYKRFKEAKELINHKGAISISNDKELTSSINYFNTFEKKIATNYIYNNCGATTSIIEHI